MDTQPTGMNNAPIASPLFTTRVRFAVSDGVTTQVVDTDKDKVVRQMPIEQSSNLLLDIYA
jgi:hypothetical protein